MQKHKKLFLLLLKSHHARAQEIVSLIVEKAPCKNTPPALAVLMNHPSNCLLIPSTEVTPNTLQVVA